MKVFLVVLNPVYKINPETWNPVFAVLEDKNQAHEIADKMNGYYVLEKVIGELG